MVESAYRVVVGIDGSKDSERALRWAAHEAQQRSGTVQAVMVYDWAGTEAALLAGPGPDGERQHTEDVLADVVTRVGKAFPGTPIATEAVRGNAGTRLTEAADDADLLVVGSHGRGRLYHAVLGSVAEACIRLAQCPVVVIPVPHETRGRAGELVPPTAEPAAPSTSERLRSAGRDASTVERR
jgi:nucleotide-binding universal stress UspA family protein